MDPMITKNEVLTFVRDIIEEVKDFDGAIEYETTLEALALDSLDYVQTQIEAKKRFGVDLSAELFITGQISTVGQLCDYIVEAQSSVGLRPLSADEASPIDVTNQTFADTAANSQSSVS
jgi:acyl carrier protein